MRLTVEDFVVPAVRGRTDVFVSGLGGTIYDLRTIIAGANKADEVWKGEERWNFRLPFSDRLV